MIYILASNGLLNVRYTLDGLSGLSFSRITPNKNPKVATNKSENAAHVMASALWPRETSTSPIDAGSINEDAPVIVCCWSIEPSAQSTTVKNPAPQAICLANIRFGKHGTVHHKPKIMRRRVKTIVATRILGWHTRLNELDNSAKLREVPMTVTLEYCSKAVRLLVEEHKVVESTVTHMAR